MPDGTSTVRKREVIREEGVLRRAVGGGGEIRGQEDKWVWGSGWRQGRNP